MLVKLRFSKDYPSDFTGEEKLLLTGLIKVVSNSEKKEYEFDSRIMNLFKFYTLLVDLGYKDVKLDVDKVTGDYYMNLFKDIIYYDEVLVEF